MKEIIKKLGSTSSFLLFGVFLLPACTLYEAELQGTPIATISLRELHVGNPEIDLRIMEAYEPLPSNLRDFYVDTRVLFEAEGEAITFDHPVVLQAASAHGRLLLGGPMLGDLTSSGVTVWMRPATNKQVILTISDDSGRVAREFTLQNPPAGTDVRIPVQGLLPDAAYTYTLEIDGDMLAQGSFTTAPLDTAIGTYRIAFGADFHKIGQHNPDLFEQIQRREPSVMLLLGDSAADDRRENMNLHRADYFTRDTTPPWVNFAANIPVYAIWDDHDYFDDDLSGLQLGMFTEEDREAIRRVWKQNWNNPATPQGHDGIYFSTRLGPVEVFMLDTRSCRDWDIRNVYGSFLGHKQQQWLLDGLRNSTAPFKLIGSGTMWSDYVSNGKDSWATWDTEALEEIFELIEEEPVGGVFLLSGDRHGARGFRIPRKSGFDLIELEVGTLGGIQGPPGVVEGLQEQIFGYDGLGFTAFGEFDFDTSSADPTVTFRLIDVQGAILEVHQWTLSERTAQ